MRLTPEQGKQLIDKLNARWKEPHRCPVCQQDSWSVSDTVFELREFGEGSIFVGKDTRIYPVIPLTCTNCGHTMFLNAINYGIVAPAQTSSPGEQQ